ncbi:20685_t:CDS:1, partial [Dentiscutata erythropus]
VMINSEDSNESDKKESSNINKLEYKEYLLALKEYGMTLREQRFIQLN